MTTEKMEQAARELSAAAGCTIEAARAAMRSALLALAECRGIDSSAYRASLGSD